MNIFSNSFSAFMVASRPKTLGATFCPVLLGTALAKVAGAFSPAIFLLTLICALLLQVLSNWVNDYGDFIRGSDTDMRLGPKRAMQMGIISLPVMKNGIALLIATIILLGLSLVYFIGWPILWIGLCSLLMSCWYTMGKRPLSYLGFAEVVVFLVFGPMATVGAFYVQTLSVSSLAFFVSLSPGFLTAALLLANNLRDFPEDSKSQKHTLVVRFGEKPARIGIVVLIFLSALGPLLVIESLGGLALLGLAPLVLPLRHVSMILKEPISARFNLMLQSIGQALYLMSILFSIGILYGHGIL